MRTMNGEALRTSSTAKPEQPCPRSRRGDSRGWRWPVVVGAAVALSPLSNQAYVHIIAIFGAALVLVHAFHKRRIPRPSGVETLMLLMAGYAMLSLLWSDSLSTVSFRTVFVEYAGVAAIYFAVLRGASSARSWRALGYCYIGGSVVAAYLVLSRGGAMMHIEGRYSIDGVNGNYTAYSLATAIPVVLGLAWERTRTVAWRITMVAIVATLGVAIMMTGSRGAAIAFLAAIAIAGLRMVTRQPIKGIVGIGVLLAVGFVAMRPWFGALPARLWMIDAENGQDWSSGRLELWSHALDIFARRPVFGNGADSYVALSPDGMHAHNVFLSVLSELGAVGLIVLVCALGGLAITYFRRGGPACMRWTAGSLMAVWGLIASTGVWQYAIPAWFAFAWVAATPVQPVLTIGRRNRASAS
jgi:O-antigen ligase